jgi:hypothetical protein
LAEFPFKALAKDYRIGIAGTQGFHFGQGKTDFSVPSMVFPLILIAATKIKSGSTGIPPNAA